MNAVIREFIKAARESPKLFFLPLTGAIEAIRRELDRGYNHPDADKPGCAGRHDTAHDRR